MRVLQGFAAALVLAAAVLVGATVVVGAAAPAVAHDQLISSTPEDGGTLTELPPRIVLEFNNELIDAAPALLIQDAAGATVHRATPVVDGRVATADFPELGDGAYRIAWSVVSSDGHRIEGSMPFELATGRPAAPLATPAEASPAGGGTPAEPASGSAAGGLGDLPAALRVAIGIGAVGAVAAVAVLALRRGRGGLRGQ